MYRSLRQGLDSPSNHPTGFRKQNLSLPHTPFPESELRLLIDRMPRLLECEQDLATVVAFVGDQVAQKCRRMRFEALHFALCECSAQQRGHGRSTFLELGLQKFAAQRHFLFDFRHRSHQIRRRCLEPHQPDVVDMRKLIAYRTALGGGNVLVVVLVDRVEQVEVNAVVYFEGFEELGNKGFHF